MLNMLRADMYRLRKSSALVVFPVAMAIVFAVFAVAEIQTGGWRGRWGFGGETYDPTFVGLAGAVGLGSVLLLPIGACGWAVWLFADDMRGGAFKTILAKPRARLQYLGASVVVCAAGSAVAVAILLGVCAWLAGSYGALEAPAADAASMAAWAALAWLTCLCFSSLVLCACTFAGRTGMVWLAAFLICYGIAGKLAMVALAILTVSGAGGAALELGSMLPSTTAYALGEGLGYLGAEGAAFKLAFYPLFWTAIGLAVAYARMRRRAL